MLCPLSAPDKKIVEIGMDEICNSLACTGCSTCVNVCAKAAITMIADKEGFLMPQIEQSQCVNCGLCVKKCPALNPLAAETKQPLAYAVISNEDRKISSSGGAFSVFARYVLARNGVIFGASFYGKDEKGTLVNQFPKLSHIPVEKLEDLDFLRGSKYIQSDIGDSFKKAKAFLKDGRFVLFTGTPCQIAGLYSFLGNKEYENLITLDLVCHGVPNQTYFGSYLEKLKKTSRLTAGGDIEGFRFRKLDSWSIVPAVKFAETKWQILEQENNSYMSAFFQLVNFRECCYCCQYSNMNRVGTMTLADYWGIGKGKKKFGRNVAAGVSLVIDNSGRMPDMREELSKWAYIEERPLNEGRMYNHNLNEPSHRPAERDTAVTDMLDDSISLRQYANKYNLLDSPIKHLIKLFFKNMIYGLGLYNTYKTISYKWGKTS